MLNIYTTTTKSKSNLTSPVFHVKSDVENKAKVAVVKGKESVKGNWCRKESEVGYCGRHIFMAAKNQHTLLQLYECQFGQGEVTGMGQALLYEAWGIR